MYDWMAHNVKSAQKGKDMLIIYILHTPRYHIVSWLVLSNAESVTW